MEPIRPPAPSIDEVVGEVLTDILHRLGDEEADPEEIAALEAIVQRALSEPPPRSEQVSLSEEETLVNMPPLASPEDPDIDEDQRPTLELVRAARSLDGCVDEAPSLRPTSSAALPRYEDEPRSRLPWAAAAAMAVLAGAAWWGRPAPAHAGAALSEAALRLAVPAMAHAAEQRSAPPGDAATADPGAEDASPAADVATTPLVVDITPRHAYLQLEREGAEPKRYAGPWPRTLRGVPGTYQAVVFRPGYRTSLQTLTVDDDLAATGFRAGLRSTDPGSIYDDP